MTNEITIQDWATETAFLYMEQGLTGDRLTPGWDLSSDDWEALDVYIEREATSEERAEVRRIVEGVVCDSSYEVFVEGDGDETVVVVAPDAGEAAHVVRSSRGGGELVVAVRPYGGSDDDWATY